LEPALERGLDACLGLGLADAGSEQVRVAVEVVAGRQRDRVHAVLDGAETGCGEPGDAARKRADEPRERLGGQRALDPAVTLREIGVVVGGAEHDLECPAAAHQAREVLCGAAAGNRAEGGLELREDRRLARREAHVARQHELAAGGAHSTLDLRDRHETARAEVVEQQRDRRLAGQLRRLLAVLRDPRQVHVGDEVVRVGAREHEHLDSGVGFRALDQRDQIADQLGP
jgi:hypothetical protein